MALDETKLQKVFEGFFRYTSDDDVTAANYFRNVAHILKKGDLILVQANAGQVVGLTGITAVTQRTPSAFGTVTVSALV